jgi:hypothetical protein
MKQRRGLSLPVVRLMLISLYLGAMVVCGVFSSAVKAGHSLSPETGQLLGIILLAVGAADYAFSLFLERHMLKRARSSADPQSAVPVIGILVGAVGASLASYGLVLSVFGVSGWALALYALCVLHGIHLAVRWPDYEEAAAGESYQP